MTTRRCHSKWNALNLVRYARIAALCGLCVFAGNGYAQELNTATPAVSPESESVDAALERPAKRSLVEQEQQLASIAQRKMRAKQTSLGDFDGSIMFEPQSMEALERILIAYELDKIYVQEDVVDEDAPDELTDLLQDLDVPEEPKEELLTLPNFYVGSILYHHADDWSLWVNRQRINHHHPELKGLPAQVQNVTMEEATLVWKPSHFERVKQYYEKQGAQSKPRLAHRHALDTKIVFDEEEKVVKVSLRSNQTFSAPLMAVIEGAIAGEGQVVIQEAGDGFDSDEVSPHTSRRRSAKPNSVEAGGRRFAPRNQSDAMLPDKRIKQHLDKVFKLVR